MELRKGQQFAGTVLRRNRRLQVDFLGFVLLYGLLQLLEFLAAALLLRIRHESAELLLTDRHFTWRLVQLGLHIFITPARILCSRTLWLRCTQAVGMLQAHGHFSKRTMVLSALQNELIRTVVLQGTVLCLFGAYRLTESAAQHTESALWLFGAAHLVLLGVLCFLGWGYVCLGLWCVPVVLFSYPKTAVWRIPLLAMGCMRGGRKALLGLLAWYGVQMLPVVTIPWVLPRAGIALTAFFHVRVQCYGTKAVQNPPVCVR